MSQASPLTDVIRQLIREGDLRKCLHVKIPIGIPASVAMSRFYGPTDAYFERQYALPDFEEVTR